MRWAFAMQISLRGSSRNFRLMRVGKTTSISRRRLFFEVADQESKKPWQASEQKRKSGSSAMSPMRAIALANDLG